MGFLGLIVLAVMLVLIGIGVGIGLFACAVAAVLVTMGVISSSVALGFYTQRPVTAVRALLLQCSVLAGIPAGAGVVWILQGAVCGVAAWQGWNTGDWEWKFLLLGAVGGAFAGVILALLFDFIFRRTRAWIEVRVKREELPG